MEIITALVSAIFGGIVATILRGFLERKKETQIHLQKLTEDKYRSLLIFMACALDINKRRYFALTEQVPNATSADYLNQIREYYYHSILYSTDSVILSLKDFIMNPTKENYVKVAKEMRKDLWNKKTTLTYENIYIE